MVAGMKLFGPTYRTTDAVRLGYEGELNGTHDISATLVEAYRDSTNDAHFELAGKFAAIGTDGVELAAAGGENAVGLFREDLQDMVNASGKATFYFRGGEYYVQEARLGDEISAFTVGGEITSDADGKIVPKEDTGKALGTVTFIGTYTNGNMYQWAGDAANGGIYLGFILHI